jgi:hypothetical protein
MTIYYTYSKRVISRFVKQNRKSKKNKKKSFLIFFVEFCKFLQEATIYRLNNNIYLGDNVLNL